MSWGNINSENFGEYEIKSIYNKSLLVNRMYLELVTIKVNEHLRLDYFRYNIFIYLGSGMGDL